MLRIIYAAEEKKWKDATKLFVVASSLSRVQLFAAPWTVAREAPQSMGFSRQEYWSGFPFPSPFMIYSCIIFSDTFYFL